MAQAQQADPIRPVMDDKMIRSFGGPKSAKFRAFIAAYVGEARLNLTEAARLAGYGDPARVGSALKRLHGEVLAAAEEEYRKGLAMSAEEATERLAAVARNPKHKDHFNAIKTLLTMHGKLDPTLNVNLTRKELNQAFDDLVAQLAGDKAAENALLEPVSEPPTN